MVLLSDSMTRSNSPMNQRRKVVHKLGSMFCYTGSNQLGIPIGIQLLRLSPIAFGCAHSHGEHQRLFRTYDLWADFLVEVLRCRAFVSYFCVARMEAFSDWIP